MPVLLPILLLCLCVIVSLWWTKEERPLPPDPAPGEHAKRRAIQRNIERLLR